MRTASAIRFVLRDIFYGAACSPNLNPATNRLGLLRLLKRHYSLTKWSVLITSVLTALRYCPLTRLLPRHTLSLLRVSAQLLSLLLTSQTSGLSSWQSARTAAFWFVLTTPSQTIRSLIFKFRIACAAFVLLPILNLPGVLPVLWKVKTNKHDSSVYSRRH